MTAFGAIATQCKQSNEGYPSEVLAFLETLMRKTEAPHRVLDAGCGTGISTRQIAELGNLHVVGVDNDPHVLRVARATPSNRIEYPDPCDMSLVGTRFQDETFVAVTAFSSFQWFSDNPLAVSGIVSILRKGGCLFVANKLATEEVVPEWPQILNTWATSPVQRQGGKAAYNPLGVMCRYSLAPEVRTWEYDEYYTAEEALRLLQSSSLWSAVPPENRAKALQHLGNIIAARARAGIVTRKVIANVVVGIKN